jgi:UDP-N-acetylmuramoyl-L-alanyl-D-glutamate--2,6-diaminopimelate ligase
MVLSKLLEGVTVTKMFQTMYGKMVLTHELQVKGIQYDSRKVEKDYLFIAIRGTARDGHKYIGNAVSRGASVVVVEDDKALPDSFFMHAGVVKVVVPDSRRALAVIASNFYHHPSKKLRLVGVTGTNGKTTTTHLVASILESAGEQVGLIGTINYRVGDTTYPATHTTPESLELNHLLVEMNRKGCSSVVMEVSSHSLALQRVFGLDFKVGAFTNLTQDHLDFHGSMEEYFKAKKLLFDGLPSTSCAVINADDPYGARIAGDTKAVTWTYGTTPGVTFHATDLELDVRGTKFTVVHGDTRHHVASSLIGRFNVTNILAAFATCSSLNVSAETILKGISQLKSVRGRFEQIASPEGWTAVVDYAHTPDALENCLNAIHEILSQRKRKIITVFGCGGDRDRGKRPLMGNIASRLSDVVIVTSDNPRNEDPRMIINDIVAGMVKGSSVQVEVDRRSAIRKALQMAREGDVVLIAGKGHEDYQVIGETKTHFDDREEVEQFIRAGR